MNNNSLNSFNVEEFEASIRRTLDEYKKLISSFPQISNIYKDLTDLTRTEDNNIAEQMRHLSESTMVLYRKCDEIEAKMTDWIVRYRNVIMQTDEDLKRTIMKISQNLAGYNQELSSMNI